MRVFASELVRASQMLTSSALLVVLFVLFAVLFAVLLAVLLAVVV